MDDIELTDADLQVAQNKFDAKQNEDKLIKQSDIESILRDCGIVFLKVALTEQLKNEEESFNKNNGFCDFETFIKIYKKAFIDQPDEEILINAIKTLMPAGMSTVPASVMREVLMNFGDRLTAEEADEFIADCDEFGGGEMDAELVSNKLINGFL